MLNNAIINLSAIKNNALNVKQKLGNSKLCAVVKADAYGHGASVVANSLYTIADCFAVAVAEEGFALRQSGIDKDILVLIPVGDQDLLRSITNRLTLTVENLSQALKINNLSKRLGVKTKIHLKVNTGMNRLGLEPSQLPQFLDSVCKFDGVLLDGVYSHYANPQQDDAFNKATDKFLLANNIVKGYNKRVTAHISASGGFLKGAYFDMVRVGILLYGYKPFECDFSVQKAMRVYAPVINTKHLSKGQNLLYGDYSLSKDSVATIVRYGYADGLPRIKTDGQLNNRCMDVTAVDKKSVKNYYPIMTDADKVAKQYDTISYEVLTKCSLRAKKIYVY